MLQKIQLQIHAEEGEEDAETGGREQDTEQQGAEVQRQQPAARDRRSELTAAASAQQLEAQQPLMHTDRTGLH